MIMDELKFDEKGLIPAIIQDYYDKRVLMLGYMNRESLELTMKTKTTWFYSRSRNRLWNKGEISGNFQRVVSIKYDCDEDALLVEVIPKGPTCHTGSESCFYRNLYNDNNKNNPEISKDIFELLYQRVKERKYDGNENSYTKYLFKEGIDKILKKVGEEVSEVIIASKNRGKKEVIYEVSDLIYHLMVLLVEKSVTLDDVRNELLKRYNK